MSAPEIGTNPLVRRDPADLAADKDPAKLLQAIIDGIAETVLEASDEDLLAESCEEGLDPTEEAEEVREILLDAALAAAAPNTGRTTSRPTLRNEVG